MKLSSSSESVLPVTEREGKGKGNMSISPGMKYGHARHILKSRDQSGKGINTIPGKILLAASAMNILISIIITFSIEFAHFYP